MCRKNKAPNGDWQGDGWGVAYQVQSSKFKVQRWQTYKSLQPIWKEEDKFAQFPKTRILVAHARSAFNPDQKGILEFNQPFIEDGIVFVFNGTLKGVRLNKNVSGKIGAQKIFNLLKDYLKTHPPEKSLKKLRDLMLKNCRQMIGLNIGLVYQNKLYLLCQYSQDEDYFQLRYNQNKDFIMAVSHDLKDYSLKRMKKGEIHVLG